MSRLAAFTVAWTALLLWGCRSQPVTWRAPLHRVIFLTDTMTWSDLVSDTLWTDGEEGLKLSASDRTALLTSGALLPNLDTSWSSELVLPFIGGPIPIPPGAEVWSEVETVNLSVPEVDLRRVRMAAGTLVLTASSTVQGPLELRYNIEGAAFPESTNGGSSEVVLQITPGEPAQYSLPLTGVELDLGGSNGLELSKLNTSWSVGVPPDATGDVGLLGSDMLSLDVAFEGLQVAQVEGRFGTRTIEVQESVNLDGLDNLQELQVAWTSLELGVEFINTAGIDLGMTIDEVLRTDGGQDPAETALVDPALSLPILLPRATVTESQGMAMWEIEDARAGYVLGTGAGNVPAFLSSIPDAFAFSGSAEVNPLGDVTGGYDRIDLERLPELEWTLTAPLNVGASRAAWVDTLEPELPEGIEFDGDLIFSLESTLPVGVSIALSLVNVPSQLLLLEGPNGAGSFFSFPVMEAAPGMGVAAGPVVSEFTLPLLPIQFSALRLGAELEVKVMLETPEAGAAFNVAQSLVVRGHLDGDAVLSIQ